MQNIIQVLLFLLLFTFLPSQAIAWSAQGHRIVAHIAYAQLTPTAKKRVDYLIQMPIKGYPLYGKTFIASSTWADQIRKAPLPEAKKFKSWHFINIPFSTNPALVLPKISQNNLLQALNENRQVLENPTASSSEKAFALRFFIHLVADAHQPLHCGVRITSKFPKGDQGGNSFPINTPHTSRNILYSDNLHGLWDSGLGLFQKRNKNLARQIESQYPAQQYGKFIKETNPASWVKECHEIGKTIAYNIGEGETPSAAYIQKGQDVTKEQLAIAGYRLGGQLNHIFR
jgi:hypothetical protein